MKDFFFLANNGSFEENTKYIDEITMVDCLNSLVASLPLRIKALIENKVIEKRLSNGCKRSDQEIAYRSSVYYDPIETILNTLRAQLIMSPTPIGLPPFRLTKNPFLARFDKNRAFLKNTVTILFRSRNIYSLRDMSVIKREDQVFLAKEIVGEAKFKEIFQGSYQHIFLPSFPKIPGSLVEKLLNPANYCPNIEVGSRPYKDYLPARAFKAPILETTQDPLETLIESSEYPYYIFDTSAFLRGHSFLFFKYLPFGFLPLLLSNQIGRSSLATENLSTNLPSPAEISGEGSSNQFLSSHQPQSLSWVDTANDQLTHRLNEKLDFSKDTPERLTQIFLKLQCGWQKTFLRQHFTIAPFLKFIPSSFTPFINADINLDVNFDFLMKKSFHGHTNNENALDASYGGLSKNSQLSRFYQRIDLNSITSVGEFNLSTEAYRFHFNHIEAHTQNSMGLIGLRFETDGKIRSQLQLGSSFIGVGVSLERSGDVNEIDPYIKVNTKLGKISIKLNSLLQYIFSRPSNQTKEMGEEIELPKEELIDLENREISVGDLESQAFSTVTEIPGSETTLPVTIGPNFATIDGQIVKKGVERMVFTAQSSNFVKSISSFAQDRLVLSALQKSFFNHYQLLFDRRKMVTILIEGKRVVGRFIESLLPYGLMTSPLHVAIKVGLALGGCVLYTQLQHLTICLEKREGGNVLRVFIRASILVTYQFGFVKLAWLISYLNYRLNLLLGIDAYTKIPFLLERWSAIDYLVGFVKEDGSGGFLSLFLQITLIQILPVFLTGCFFYHIFCLSFFFYRAILLRSSSDIRFSLISLLSLPLFLTFQELNRRWLAQDPQIKTRYLVKVREKLIDKRPSS